MARFLIGTDPEMIILGAGGLPVSAEALIGAGKDVPLVINEEVSVHEDNILVEFNISPAKNAMDFVKKNIMALYLINEQFIKPKGLKISRDCFAEFEKKYLVTEQAMAVGCSPEFDALTGDIIDPPIFADGFAGRSAGGHVHVGYENENYADSMMIVKLLDLHLGVPSLILDPDTRRRQIYGKPSSYRRTEGLKVEYRTLSNFWIFEKTLMEWIYEVVAKVVDEVKSGTIIDDDLYITVRQTIENNDIETAQKLISQNALLMPYGEKMDILALIEQTDSPFLKEFLVADGGKVEIVAVEAESEFEANRKRNQEFTPSMPEPVAHVPVVKDPVAQYEESSQNPYSKKYNQKPSTKKLPTLMPLDEIVRNRLQENVPDLDFFLDNQAAPEGHEVADGEAVPAPMGAGFYEFSVGGNRTRIYPVEAAGDTLVVNEDEEIPMPFADDDDDYFPEEVGGDEEE